MAAADDDLIRSILQARGQVRGRGVGGGRMPRAFTPTATAMTGAAVGGGVPGGGVTAPTIPGTFPTSLPTPPGFQPGGAVAPRALPAVPPAASTLPAGLPRPPGFVGAAAPAVATGAAEGAAGAALPAAAGAAGGGGAGVGGTGLAGAAAGGGMGLGGGLAGAGRALMTRGVGGPVALGLMAGNISAGMANEGTHPYANIPGLGDFVSTEGDSLGDQFKEGLVAGGPVGALVNPLIGGLQNMGLFDGGGGGGDSDEPKPKEGIHRVLGAFDQAASSGMLDPALRDQYAAYYNMLLEVGGGNSKENRQAASDAVLGKLMEDATAGMGVMGQQQTGPTPADILAQQAQVAAIVQPYTDAMSQNAAARNQLLQGMVGGLPEEFQGVMGAASSGQGLAQQQLIQALGAQAAMVPHTLSFDAMTQQQNAIASQLQQQQLQGLINPPTAAAPGLSLDALLAAQPQG